MKLYAIPHNHELCDPPYKKLQSLGFFPAYSFLEEVKPEWQHPFKETPYDCIRFVGVDDRGRALYNCPWRNPKRLYTAKRALSLAAKRFGAECIYCKQVIDDRITIDHIIPRYRGGSNDLANFFISCAPCNNRKGHMLVEDFAPLLALRWRLACGEMGYFPLTMPEVVTVNQD